MSAYGRCPLTRVTRCWKLEKNMGGRVWQSCLEITECECVYAKYLSTHNVITVKKYPLEVPGGLKKPVNSPSLAIFFSTVHLREVAVALSTWKWGSASAYKRCPLAEG